MRHTVQRYKKSVCWAGEPAIVARMASTQPHELGLIAGKGAYPLLLADSARRAGVRRLCVLAFKGETERRIADAATDIQWIHVGQLGRLLDAFRAWGVQHAVMAGQITPTHLFRVRLDGAMLAVLRRLKVRNAETIFGAVGDELRAIGVDLLPAHLFMEEHMPGAGVLTSRAPTPEQEADIRFGLRVAHTTSGLDIGQTVVVKNGTVIAVEAFEGTDQAILRAGRLAGPGCVVVKVAKQGHDMRFDIPVVGLHTAATLRKARVAAMAVEAGRCIVLEREAVTKELDRRGVTLVAVAAET